MTAHRSTLVFVHAHPDDEATQTSGTMARAIAEGHRVVCIYATGGEEGTRPEGVNDEAALAAVRRAEAEASAAVVGTQRLVWLGYRDSGMLGWDSNDDPRALARAAVTDVGRKIAAILDEEDADAVVGYDFHGGYGHPDHVMVHRIVHEAAQLARRRPRLLEASMNRDRLRRMMQEAVAAGVMPAEGAWDVDAPQADGYPVGTAEVELSWAVDVAAYLDTKRAALACHASQEDAASLLAMPREAFDAWMSQESYREPGRPAGLTFGWPFS